jgi:hypothetical protein
VSKRVPESVRVKILNSGEFATVLDPIPSTIRRQGAALGEEERIQVCPAVMSAHAYVPVESACGAGAEVDRPNLVAFAFDDRHALVEIEIINT